MSKKIVVISLFVVLSLISCEKNVDVLDPITSKTGAQTLKSVSGNSFYVSDAILKHFVHYCQRQAGPPGGNYPTAEGTLSYPDSKGACNPTSYMMAAACLAKYKDGPNTTYKPTGTKLASLVRDFKKYPNGWQSIITTRNYCNAYDGSWLNATYMTYTAIQRANAKAQLETWLTNNKFVLVPVFANVDDFLLVNQNILFVNNSTNVDLSSTANTKNYIKTTGTLKDQHVILIIRVDKNDNSPEGGVVSYIDPLSITRTTSNRKYVSYKRFLDSVVGANKIYPMTAVGLR